MNVTTRTDLPPNVCVDCDAPVRRLTGPAGDPLTLNADTNPCGLWLPDPNGRTCRKLTAKDALAGRHGHHLHECAPTAAAWQQPTLFNLDSTRGPATTSTAT